MAFQWLDEQEELNHKFTKQLFFIMAQNELVEIRDELEKEIETLKHRLGQGSPEMIEQEAVVRVSAQPQLYAGTF